MEIRNLTHLFASSCALSAAGQCVLACTTDAVETRGGGLLFDMCE